MSHPRMIPMLLMATALGWSAASAQLVGGGGSQPKLIEAPPTFGSCVPPISTVTSQSETSQETDLSVTNSTTSTAHDFLVIHVTVNGVPRLFWAPLNLPSGAHGQIAVTFLHPVDGKTVELCGNYPVGVTDNPDPCGITIVVSGDSP